MRTILMVATSFLIASNAYAVTGGGIDLSDANDNVDLGNHPSIQSKVDEEQGWTLAGWIFLDTLAADAYLIGDTEAVNSNQDGITAWIATDGELSFSIKEDGGGQQRTVTTSSTSPYATGAWTHWAVKWDAGSGNIGALDGDGNLDTTSDAFVDDAGKEADGIFIGTSNASSDDMDGKMAYVLFYEDQDLTAAEIASALDDPGSNTTGLISAYYFCDGSLETDSGSEAINGTNSGGTFTASGPTITSDPCASAATTTLNAGTFNAGTFN